MDCLILIETILVFRNISKTISYSGRHSPQGVGVCEVYRRAPC